MRDRIETREWGNKTEEEKKKELHELIVSLTEDSTEDSKEELNCSPG